MASREKLDAFNAWLAIDRALMDLVALAETSFSKAAAAEIARARARIAAQAQTIQEGAYKELVARKKTG